MKTVFVIRECVCGGDHARVEFIRFPQPDDPYIFEGICPTNGTKLYVTMKYVKNHLYVGGEFGLLTEGPPLRAKKTMQL